MGSKKYLTFLAIFVMFVLIAPMTGGIGIAGTNVTRPVSYNLYFGDLHTHTAYSDAWEGTPWDAFSAAIDGGADFMAVTDHVAFWNAYSGLTMDSEEWSDTLLAADYYTSRKFAALPAYEAWLLAHLGEINVYNIQELLGSEDRNVLRYKFDRLPDFYDWLADRPGAIGQFNHPYYMTNAFEGFSYYTEKRDRVMNIIEVWNTEFTEDYYIMALDAGWHLMPSANSDTHSPDWISGYEMRTVLLAEKLTPTDLYAAMRAHRGYATLDKNLRISYTLNGAVMGSVLGSTSTCTAVVHIEDPDRVASDKITKVEIVSDGGAVVATLNADSTIVDWTVTFNSAGLHYFYVRVTTLSPLNGSPGVTAWTAPVWVGK